MHRYLQIQLRGSLRIAEHYHPDLAQALDHSVSAAYQKRRPDPANPEAKLWRQYLPQNRQGWPCPRLPPSCVPLLWSASQMKRMNYHHAPKLQMKVLSQDGYCGDQSPAG